jgi:two-component system, chemotaxis family, protein-glutamate methylesterase/glutaminase
VQQAVHLEVIAPGRCYVAPPDRHLLLERGGYMRLSRGPKENHSRPAADVLFRSAAYAFGSRVVGVVLSGALDDGTAGLWAIKESGGIAIAQDPEEAQTASMPRSAIESVDVDYILRIAQMPDMLVTLARSSSSGSEVSVRKELETEVKIAREDNAIESGITEWGKPSIFTCPECHGVLLELKEGKNKRFRCHTGHAYSMRTLLEDLQEKGEAALWNAQRTLEEQALLLRQMADIADSREHSHAAVLRNQSEHALKCASNVRDIIMNHNGGSEQGALREDPAARGGTQRSG